MSAPKVAVLLTKHEIQLLRSLIVQEAKRVDPHGEHNVLPQRRWHWKLRRMLPVARKLLTAAETFDGIR